MDNLSNNIYQYYVDHFDELDFDKQFHFVSRTYLWSQNVASKNALDRLRSGFTANENPLQALDAIIEAAKSNPVHGSKNAAELRRPYFERYPRLKTYVTVLFRITFLLTVYGIDVRDQLKKLFDVADLERLAKDLQADHEALAILSTHAVNFLYLYERVVKADDSSLSPDAFLAVGRSAYDTQDRIHLQLLIYLYTHCIIGESQFYYRAMPDQHRDGYLAMMAELEDLMRDHFKDVNLDNKCEFLVCAKITGYATRLTDRIYAEAAESVSDSGTFLIDRHNANPQVRNTTLDLSEHRNVLFIMSAEEYTPLAATR